MTMYGVVELGGTKTLVATGFSPESLSSVIRIETTDPATTLGQVVDRLREPELDAVGVASFGPLELRAGHPQYGSIVSTPKPGWSGADLVGILERGLGVPVGIDTDVNGAAMAEGRWGAATGLDHHVYITVGTGIGVGIVTGWKTIPGLSHPEMGHLTVTRHSDDDHPGSCPFHRDCLEGMASGPALEARFGAALNNLEANEAVAAVDLAAFYVAQGVRDIIYAFSPERVVIGGGVSKLPGFHDLVQVAFVAQLGGYHVLAEYGSDGFITAPRLGDKSGLLGGLIIAERSLE